MTVCLAPLTRFRADTGPRAIEPNLFGIQQHSGVWICIETNLQCLHDIDILDGELPGQEYQRAILLGGEIGHLKATTVARDDSMRLACIEYNGCTPG